MTDKELKKLKRSELLEILFFLQKEFDELKAENEALTEKVKLLENQLLESSDSLSENDLEKVSEIVNSSLNTNTAGFENIASVLENTIEKWQQQGSEQHKLADAEMAEKVGRLLDEYRSEQAAAKKSVLKKDDLRNLAAVFDYIIRCNIARVRREDANRKSDLQAITKAVSDALAQQAHEKSGKRTLSNEDLSYIYSVVKKANLEKH